MESDSLSSKLIESLRELVAILSINRKANFGKIVHKVQIPDSDFLKYASWSTEKYVRNCIVENDEFELILICWEKGQQTPIHDHGGEECWVLSIDGGIEETIYKENDLNQLEIISENTTTRGDISYMIDFMGCHSLKNASSSRKMTLHLYAKPIRECNVFDDVASKFINKKLVYDTSSDAFSLGTD